LRDVDRATLPDREALARLLGLPPAVGPPDAEMDLAYCLVPCDETSNTVARFAVRFGRMGELEHMKVSYFRYAATLDFVAPVPLATVELRPR